MTIIEHADETLYVWDVAPNWSSPVEGEFAVPSRTDAGLSDRESRRRTGESLRVTQLSFTCVCQGDAWTRLRSAAKSRTTERVAMPFWPAAAHPDTFGGMGVTAGLHLTCNLVAGLLDLSDYLIHEGDVDPEDFTITERTITVPLLLGHVADLDPSLWTGELAEVRVRFSEDSGVDEALVITAPDWANGPTINAANVVQWPIAPDWSRRPKAGGTRLILERETLGQGRRSRQDYHDATPYESIELSFVCPENWGDLLAFFHEHSNWQQFWLPVPGELTTLAAAKSVGNTVVVSDAAMLAVGDSVVIVDGTHAVVVRIDGIAANTLTLDRSVEAFGASAWITPAALARLVKRRLRIRWTSAEIAHAVLEFRELPPEAVEPAPESADSLGAQTTLASLYTFTSRPPAADPLSDPVVAGRFTSFERDLADGETTWAAIEITHGSIKRGIDLQDECTLQAEMLQCPVLLSHFRNNLGTVDVTIERAEVAGGDVTNRSVVFTGEIRKLKAVGTQATANCGIPRVFDGVLPRAKLMPVCQWALFSTPCQLAVADWTFTARIADVGTPGYPFEYQVDTVARKNVGSGQNLLATPSQLDLWAMPRVTVTANTATSPDGSATADTVENSLTGNNFYYVNQTLFLEADQPYTIACYAKFNGKNSWIWLLGEGNANIFAFFDIENGVTGSATGFDSSTIVDAGNGWYRCVATFTKLSASAHEQVGVGLANSNGDTTLNPSAAGDGSVLLWGATLETLPDGFGSANWFAWGFLKSEHDDIGIGIRQSTAISGGAMTLTLSRDLHADVEVGDMVDLVPGCDGLAETCRAYHAEDNPTGKFDNFLNWGGGRPAAANLSLIRLAVPTQNNSAAKK